MSIASPLDKLNESIIDLLQHDRRMPFAGIATNMGVSEGTIRNRINSMKNTAALRIVMIADPMQVEYETDAMLGLTFASIATPQVVNERLEQFPEVVFVSWVSGCFNLLVEIVSAGREEFLSFLDEHIYSQADIGSVEVMTGLKNFKNQFLLKHYWN